MSERGRLSTMCTLHPPPPPHLSCLYIALRCKSAPFVSRIPRCLAWLTTASDAAAEMVSGREQRHSAHTATSASTSQSAELHARYLSSGRNSKDRDKSQCLHLTGTEPRG